MLKRSLLTGQGVDPPKFTLKTILFAVILIINGLGSTAFAMASVIPEEQPSSPVGEGQHFSRGAHTARQTISWTGSESMQGAREIPRVTSASIGATVAGIAGGTAASAILQDTAPQDTAPQEAIQQELSQINERLDKIEQDNNTRANLQTRVNQLEGWWVYRWFGGLFRRSYS